MLNFNTAVLNQNFSEALQDPGFRKSSFFPTNLPMIGLDESKKVVIEVYRVYQDYKYKQSLFRRVFEIPDNMERILFFASEDTLEGIVPYLSVCKPWLWQSVALLKRKWALLTLPETILVSILPRAMRAFLTAPAITRQHSPTSDIIIKLRTLLHALSKHICPKLERTTLANTCISPENIEKIVYDNALQIIWNNALRVKLVGLNIQNLPEADASADIIRVFLKKNCNVLGQITDFPPSSLQGKGLTVIPPEFKLLTGLISLNLSDNQIEVIQNLDNCPALTRLSLYKNRIRVIENLDNCPALTLLILGSNLIEVIQSLNCPALIYLFLDNNKIKEIHNSGVINCPALTLERCSALLEEGSLNN